MFNMIGISGSLISDFDQIGKIWPMPVQLMVNWTRLSDEIYTSEQNN